MSRNKNRNQASGLVISSKKTEKQGQTKHLQTKADVEEVSKQLPREKHEPHEARLTKHYVSLSPASVRISSQDPKRTKAVNYEPRKTISKWSNKSRSNMVSRLLTLDYSPLFGDPDSEPVFITLTYPNEWETVVPDGSTFKTHIKELRARYYNDFREELIGLWKMEFQRRGAPHLHILTSLTYNPADLREWLSWAWADIVNHPDENEKAKHEAAGTRVDSWPEFPREKANLIAIYFSKHSSPNKKSVKDYQHIVPQLWKEADDVGRFWGYWGLEPAEVKTQISESDALYIKRTLRRWHKASSKTVRVRVPRTNSKTGEVTYRFVHRKQKRMTGSGGFLSVPDGVSMGQVLALALENRRKGLPVQESHEVSNLSVFGLDSGVGGSQQGVLFDEQSSDATQLFSQVTEFSFQSTVLLSQLFDSGHRAPHGHTLTLDWFSNQRGVRRQPTHVNQSGTRNPPHTLRQVSTTSVKLTLIRFITKLRRRKPRQTHGLSHCVDMLFRDVLRKVFKVICHVFYHNKNNNRKY
ncbi:hypothetical protein M2113_000609 [Aurantimicrobium minutum]|uniref:rolling circle replication-associated protein n=1 Tax=Aurantimicrobium minutum TaxID=708131 RepID=UPI00247427E3|nr:hypothetical protein [Aurantimicrobium minutum]MDH6409648.1 hypothetical protein [Aurantimicrobium minutum]